MSSEPRAELQRLARIVERSRQRLEELDRRKQGVLEVVEDHGRQLVHVADELKGAAEDEEDCYVGGEGGAMTTRAQPSPPSSS